MFSKKLAPPHWMLVILIHLSAQKRANLNFKAGEALTGRVRSTYVTQEFFSVGNKDLKADAGHESAAERRALTAAVPVDAVGVQLRLGGVGGGV